MRFFIDAQMPRQPAHWLNSNGHDCLHTLDIPEGNRTTDAEINALSVREQRVVITKNSDFVEDFWLSQAPYKLVLVSTGNIANNALEEIFGDNLDAIVQALTSSDFVELGQKLLIVHR